MIKDKDSRPSKCTAQLYDWGVPSKIQLLRIPETCEETSKEGEMSELRETNVLSPRKLKKTSGVSCCVSVDESGGYWNKVNKRSKMNKMNKINKMDKT